MDRPAEGRALPGWTVWAVLGASALPLVLLVLFAQRTLLGSLPSYLADDQTATGYGRASYLLQVVQPDRLLVLPLLGLALAVGLARCGPVAPRADLARTAGTALAGLVGLGACGVLGLVAYLLRTDPPAVGNGVFFGGTSLETLGPPATGAVVLAVLAAVLGVLLRVRPAVPTPPEPEPSEPVGEPHLGATVPVRLVEGDARDAPSPAVLDAHSPFRRPVAPVAREDPDPLSAYRRT